MTPPRARHASCSIGSFMMVAEPAKPDEACDTPEMAEVVQRNIRALVDVRRAEDARRGMSDRIADAVTRFAGTMWCVYVHAALIGAWVAVNGGWVPGVRRFDPTFVLLATFASVEAIFLSTFILISQNRMQRMADRRADLDLQISLLTEHELTRVAQLLDGVARRLDAPLPPEEELAQIKRDVRPEAVVRELEKAEEVGDSGLSGASGGPSA
jgi:uncharacterized membrane protein